MTRTDRWLFAIYISAFFAVLGACGAMVQWDRVQWREKYPIVGHSPFRRGGIDCDWQNRIAYATDPRHDSVKVPGIIGEIWFFDELGGTMLPTGDMYVMAWDETLHSDGQPAKKPEMWNIEPTTLQHLTSKSKFGEPCYEVFLPWPKEWADVRKIRIQVKFRSEKSKDSFTSEKTIDFASSNSSQRVAP